MEHVMRLSTIYLLLALTGLGVPFYYFSPFIVEHGIDVELIYAELLATHSALFVTLDLLISAVVVLIYILVDAGKNGVRRYWIAFWGTILLGVSFGLPLYLYFKEKQKQRVPGPHWIQ